MPILLALYLHFVYGFISVTSLWGAVFVCAGGREHSNKNRRRHQSNGHQTCTTQESGRKREQLPFRRGVKAAYKVSVHFMRYWNGHDFIVFQYPIKIARIRSQIGIEKVWRTCHSSLLWDVSNPYSGWAPAHETPPSNRLPYAPLK